MRDARFGYDRRMHPQLAAALGRLDSVTRDLHTMATSIPQALRTRKPSPERWCIGEVLEHVSMVEQLFVERIVTNIERARAAGLASEVDAPDMLTDQLRDVIEDRRSRRNAPETVLPTGQVDATTSLQRIEDSHARLRDACASCDGLALSTVTHDHRFFGTLNVYQWVDLIAGHERRHLAQIREVAMEVAATN